MEEQRIILLRVRNQPLHGPNDVISSRHGSRITGIVSEDDDILGLIPESFCSESYVLSVSSSILTYGGTDELEKTTRLTADESMDVVYIIDTTCELSRSAEVVDTDLPSALTPDPFEILTKRAFRRPLPIAHQLTAPYRSLGWRRKEKKGTHTANTRSNCPLDLLPHGGFRLEVD